MEWQTAKSQKLKADAAYERKAWNRAVMKDTFAQCHHSPRLRRVQPVHACTLLGKEIWDSGGLKRSSPRVEIRNADCVQVATEPCNVPPVAGRRGGRGAPGLRSEALRVGPSNTRMGEGGQRWVGSGGRWGKAGRGGGKALRKRWPQV